MSIFLPNSNPKLALRERECWTWNLDSFWYSAESLKPTCYTSPGPVIFERQRLFISVQTLFLAASTCFPLSVFFSWLGPDITNHFIALISANHIFQVFIVKWKVIASMSRWLSLSASSEREWALVFPHLVITRPFCWWIKSDTTCKAHKEDLIHEMYSITVRNCY